MNNYYKTLELHKILELLSKQCSNDKTKEIALSLEPMSALTDVCAELQKTTDAYDLSSKLGTPSFCNFKDVCAAIKRAQAGASLSLKELLEIKQVLSQIRQLADWYRDCEMRETSISYLFDGLFPNKRLEEKLEMSILSEEEIADGASVELTTIRRKILQSGSKIRDSLDKMIKSATVQKYLQENLVTMRDGRYVLPVKAEHKNELQGLVHDISSSGSTFFIEPIAVVEANNDIRVLKGREQDEIERIVAELSAECAECGDGICTNYLDCVELNLYFAKANLGAKMRGITPILTDNGQIDLKNARHPLIDSKTVVPISIKLGEDYSALIITGPNTGGKTVVLKTVGLLTAMTMCGLLIPASDGSKISVFDNILVDIGDQQSIEQSLSTFSSHMNKVIEIIKTADRQSLILLDELGSGTDPVEGAALAVAVIDRLQSLGSRLLVTTHYQELKLYAIQTAGIENASCEFNVTTLQPTYRLIIGSPGKSNAFAISSRLGVPDEIINYAQSLVTNENKRFEEVVEQLERARLELDEQNDEIRRLKNEQQVKTVQLTKELDSLQKTKDAELEKARVQSMRIVESVRMQSDKLMDELDTLRKDKEKENFAQLALEAKARVKSTLGKLYNEANPIGEDKNKDYKLPRALKRGDTVLMVDMNKNGILASDPDGNGTVFVQAGIMKTRVNVSRLRLVETEKITYSGRKITTKNVATKADREVKLDLDIRGNNVDEGLNELGMFIDGAVMSGAGLITIIHGKGTGVLRTAVHRYLKEHPSIKSFRLGVYGEGEDGVTIAEIK